MDKNKELTENLYNACKNWLENFEWPLDEWKKTCQQKKARKFIQKVGVFKWHGLTQQIY